MAFTQRERPVILKVDGIDIAGRLYMPDRIEGQTRKGLIICHGIPAQAKNVDDQGYPLLAERFRQAGYITLIFNFRGCGLSGGNFDMPGWSRDLEAAIDLVHPETDHLWLLGFSAGAVTSIYTAAQDSRVAGVVSCACPGSFKISTVNILEQARKIGIIRDADFPRSIEEWTEGFDIVSPVTWIDKISPRPLLIVHGDQDEVVPVGDAWTLHNNAKGPKDIEIISGAGHRLRLSDEAMNFVMRWLEQRE